MRILSLLVIAVLLAPVAIADHPGSNLGLSRYSTHQESLVHRVTDVDADFTRLDREHPELVDRMTIGVTGILNLPLLAVRVTNEAVPFHDADLATGQKLRVYLDGGHHGNEFLGVDLVMYYLEDLISKAAAGDPDVEAFLKTHEVYATPIVNPEGNLLDTRKNANQVDPNRNYAFQFGGPGSGDTILDLNYRGPSSFSEPEVLANAEFARSIMPDLWITMHTGVAEFYWPWGWTHDKSPDEAFFKSIEQPFENATNGRVDAMMAAELYLAAGATDDWGYGQLGVPSHTFEVHEDQFIPVYGEGIPAEIEDQLNGLDWVVKNTRTWGAWLSLDVQDGAWYVANEGWGVASNVTLSVDGTESVIPEINPGTSVPIATPEWQVFVKYRQLLIDAPEAKTRLVEWRVDDVSPGQLNEFAPGAPVALVLVAVAALAVSRRARS